MKPRDYDFIIIGAGVAGASAFHWLTTIPNTKTLILEEKSEKFNYRSARILVTHAQQYLHPDVPLNDPSIGTRSVKTIGHSSKNDSVLLKGFEEFGVHFGMTIDEVALSRWYVSEGKKKGGMVSWESKATKISKNIGFVEVEYERDQQTFRVSGSLLIIATGAYSPDLQKSVGFGVPDSFNYLLASFHAKPDDIESTFQMDWDFHLNPKISEVGPFQVTRAKDFFNIIMLSNESYEVMEDKFLRIVKNYKPIQFWFQKTKERPENLKASDLVRGKLFKHPIDRFYTDNIVLLGESTGFVTECYNEGLVGGLGGSKFLFEVISSIISKTTQITDNPNDNLFPASKLKEYQDKFRKELMGNFHASQKGSEKMFLTPGRYQQDIWDAYIKAIKEDRTVRKNIHNAWVSPDLANYPLENDNYCGEKIYLALPFQLKITLGPMFLKMKFFK
jgi:flavin-dependent dehydrogenase